MYRTACKRCGQCFRGFGLGSPSDPSQQGEKKVNTSCDMGEKLDRQLYGKKGGKTYSLKINRKSGGKILNIAKLAGKDARKLLANWREETLAGEQKYTEKYPRKIRSKIHKKEAMRYIE